MSCDCDLAQQITELRRMKNRGGSWVVVRQCLNCFQKVGGMVKRPDDFMLLPLFDEAAESSYWEGKRQKAVRQLEAAEQRATQENEEWWRKYNTYLQSQKWRDKRQRVLARCGSICEACMNRTASEVHHLTYEHVFDEPLFDLVGVCKTCHDALTAMSRSRRMDETL